MATNTAETSALEVKMRDTHSKTVAGLKTNYVAYVAERHGGAVSYADYCAIAEHLQRVALADVV